MTPEEIEWNWFRQLPIEGSAFTLNDAVQIVSGSHAGAFGSTISLAALVPEPRYCVELATGGDIIVAESELRSAELREPLGVLSALQHWYARQTDGDWEHSFGIHLGTLDNPGWSLTIDLADTELADRPFVEINETDPERDWIVCRVVDGKYEARGGPFMLERMLREFSVWARLDSPPAA